MFADSRKKEPNTNDLSVEQLHALAKLPDHKDPFFAVHQAMHAIKASFWGITEIPLSESHVRGECGAFSDCAAMAFRRLFSIDKKDLFLIQLATFINGAKLKTFIGQENPNIATDGEHAILYIRNGLRFISREQGDIFFDSTAGQFSGKGCRDRTEKVFEYLKNYHGDEGKEIAEILYKRGYVKIPQGEEGARRLGILVASYRSKKFNPLFSR